MSTVSQLDKVSADKLPPHLLNTSRRRCDPTHHQQLQALLQNTNSLLFVRNLAVVTVTGHGDYFHVFVNIIYDAGLCSITVI